MTTTAIVDAMPDFGHPWAICTCNFAELYYRVAADAKRRAKLGVPPEAAAFFRHAGVTDSGTLEGAALGIAIQRLTRAGGAMLRAVLYHSDQLELSEQFDRWTGHEKSVRNLTWRYASFLSAVRARPAL